MRVTEETKSETRQRILQTALSLFRKDGYETTTTRDISRHAGIGIATLFNYFPTKEAIVATLVASAIEKSQQQQQQQQQKAREADDRKESLAEALFARVAIELRCLKPYRALLGPLLETALSPLTDDSERFRGQHLESVVALASRHGQDLSSPIALQLYWTLYIGVHEAMDLLMGLVNA